MIDGPIWMTVTDGSAADAPAVRIAMLCVELLNAGVPHIEVLNALATILATQIAHIPCADTRARLVAGVESQLRPAVERYAAQIAAVLAPAAGRA
jgi:hypothetical protein